MAQLAPVGNGRRNLIINYVPQCFNEDKFCNLFAPYGPIESVKLVYRNSMVGYHQRGHVGFGFVKYVSEEHAEAAMQCMNGVLICGKKLKVSYARNTPGTNVCIRKICNTWREEDIYNVVAAYGPIVNVRLIFKPRTQGNHEHHHQAANSMCCHQVPPYTAKAYVIFENHVDALNAISALSHVIFPGCVSPMTFQFINRNGTDKKLFIKGIEQIYFGTTKYCTIQIKRVEHSSPRVIERMFGEYGDVIHVFIVREHNGSFTACVVMRDYLAAVNAVLTIKFHPESQVIVLANYH